MVHAWGGFSNGQIPLSAMREVQGQYFEPDMADRMEYLISQVPVHFNEGYRPMGVPADQYVRNESQTSTGGSNAWFQWGRYQRGETPSAANPANGGGSHGWGMACDMNPGRGTHVEEVCRQIGIVFPIQSESWHAQTDDSITPTVNYKKTSRRKEMFLVNNGSAEFVIGQEYLHHVSGPAEESALIAVLGPVVWKGGADFDNILKGCGIPADKVKLVMGGKTWSRATETLQAVQAGGGSGATPAAIAKAVNDDAAKRMSS